MSKISLAGNGSGTGIFTIASPNSNTDRTLTLPDATGTILTTATPGVPVNGPAFSAYLASSQSVGNNVYTKVTINTENFDTASAFDSSTNYRFTPQVAGYYQINGGINFGGVSMSIGSVVIYKNGSAYKAAAQTPNSTYYSASCVSDVIYLNGSTDYVELYGLLIASSGNIFYSVSSPQWTYFSGALVRSA